MYSFTSPFSILTILLKSSKAFLNSSTPALIGKLNALALLNNALTLSESIFNASSQANIAD